METVVDKGFRTRIGRWQRGRSARRSNAYLLSHNLDGVAIARYRAREGGGVWGGIAFAVVAAFLVKVCWVAWLGAPAFDQQIERLAAGTTAERAAAFVMQSDPVTTALAAYVAPYLHR